MARHLFTRLILISLILAVLAFPVFLNLVALDAQTLTTNLTSPAVLLAGSTVAKSQTPVFILCSPGGGGGGTGCGGG